jgi:hypothetical protein
MKSLSNNITPPHDLESKGNDSNYYLVAMLVTAVLLFVFAYYDQILSGFIR